MTDLVRRQLLEWLLRGHGINGKANDARQQHMDKAKVAELREIVPRADDVLEAERIKLFGE